MLTQRTRQIASITVLLLLALLLVACGSGDEAPTTEDGVAAEPDPVADPEAVAVTEGDGEAGSLVIYSGRSDSLVAANQANRPGLRQKNKHHIPIGRSHRFHQANFTGALVD